MIDCTIKQATLYCRWVFEDSFISLPEPGSQEFNDLYHRLRSYGISLSSISFDEPVGNKLADDALRMVMLNGRVTVRLLYSSFELLATDLYDGDEKVLTGISDSLLEWIRRAGVEPALGRATLTWQGYLGLRGTDADSFINSHVCGARQGAQLQLVPNAFAYTVKLGAATEEPVARVVGAKSVHQSFPDDLYVELANEYFPPGDSQRVATRFQEDMVRVFLLLGLKLETETEVDNADQ
jgi:hypothetical protein